MQHGWPRQIQANRQSYRLTLTLVPALAHLQSNDFSDHDVLVVGFDLACLDHVCAHGSMPRTRGRRRTSAYNIKMGTAEDY